MKKGFILASPLIKIATQIVLLIDLLGLEFNDVCDTGKCFFTYTMISFHTFSLLMVDVGLEIYIILGRIIYIDINLLDLSFY